MRGRPVLLLLPLLAACGERAGAADPGVAPPASASRLADPQRVRHVPEILASGTLRSRLSAGLAPAVAGTLQRVAVVRGQTVAEGAVLLELEPDLARAQLAQAEAGLAAAEAGLKIAEDGLGRLAEIEKNQGGVTAAQMVQVRSQRDLAAAQILAARAQVQQAQVNLRHHVLRAPFAGVVTSVPDGLGMPVSPGAPLVSLEAVRQLVLETSLAQDEAAQVRTGAKVEVWVPATGARTGEATVTVRVPAVDSATGRVPVEVAVPNADGRFLPHASARARFPAGAPRDAWRVDAASLVQRDGAFAVWTAGADGRARALPVRVLAQEGESALVDPGAPGWPPGVQVVERPPLGIAEGAPLEARR